MNHLVSQIAAAGVDTYLKMMLTDNFVHTDLHPGNILARSAGNLFGTLDRNSSIVLHDEYICPVFKELLIRECFSPVGYSLGSMHV